MEIHFIIPSIQKTSAFSTVKLKKFAPPLSLLNLAALTPSDYNVTIFDEQIEDINFDHVADLTAITVHTFTAKRAYEISSKVREKGGTVVVGGIHPTMVPEESMQYVDAVVLGEAEEIWPEVLSDFSKNELKQVYKRDNFPDIRKLPFPRRELIKEKDYLFKNLIQTARGCPFNCEFCAIPTLSGGNYRDRPISEVLKEIESLEGQNIFFVDEAINANPQRAKALFKALLPLNIKWTSDCTLAIGKDPDLLELAAKSGCMYLFIGMESIDQKNLIKLNKKQNVFPEIADAIKRIHDYGIAIEASFIFGLDEDDDSVFDNTLEFLYKNKIDFINVYPLTPFPGTPLYKRLKSEKRIIDNKWWLSDECFPDKILIHPLKMTEEALANGLRHVYEEFYSWENILKRLSRVSLENMNLVFKFNKIKRHLHDVDDSILFSYSTLYQARFLGINLVGKIFDKILVNDFLHNNVLENLPLKRLINYFLSS